MLHVYPDLDPSILYRLRRLVSPIFTLSLLRGLGRIRRRNSLASAAVEVFGELAGLRERTATEDADKIVASEEFLGEELLGDETEFLFLLCEEGAAALVGFVDDTTDFGVDAAGGFIGERLVHLRGRVVFVIQVRESGGHSEFGYHEASHAGDFVEVVARAAGDRVEMKFLTDAATEGHGHAVH